MSELIPPAGRGRLPRSFRAVIKPIGSLCNLECTYCYYLHKKDLLPGTTGRRITDDLLEEFIRQYLAEQDVEEVVFTWHGGEPALLGLDFYRKVVELQEKYGAGKRIKNDLQTNGVLLDDAWCEFLKEHGFLVGLSIDGPKELHDCFRRVGTGMGISTVGEARESSTALTPGPSPEAGEGSFDRALTRAGETGEGRLDCALTSAGEGGEGSFDRVYAAARRLREHGVPFNAVTVIHAVNVRHPEEVYRFLTEELGCRRVQWLPCAELKNFRRVAPGRWDTAEMPVVGSRAARPGSPESVVTDWSVDPDDWGEFLCRTFDLWMKEGLGKVLVNWFESLVGQWMGLPAQICSLGEVCGRSLIAMESDGSLYSCDRFVFPEYKLGNLCDSDRRLGDVVYSIEQREFGCKKRNTLPDYCRSCPYGFACNGECPKSRFLKTPDGQPGLNYFCSGIKRFLEYADPYLRQIAAAVQRKRGIEPLGTSVEVALRE
ncbi:MAG: radical SAM protein [Bryobacteraceae bacterium]|nr:radical SAM protein [Bryobacteraceae bacterium]